MKNRTVIPANITVDIVRILTASMKLLANVLMIILASGQEVLTILGTWQFMTTLQWYSKENEK